MISCAVLLVLLSIAGLHQQVLAALMSIDLGSEFLKVRLSPSMFIISPL